MKVLVLNGSPRGNGLVSHDLTVRPCTGCMSCRSKLRCALPEDDAHRVAEEIRTAEIEKCKKLARKIC